MEARGFLAPLRSASTSLCRRSGQPLPCPRWPLSPSLCQSQPQHQQQIRHESSARRTKKALRVPPHPSFLPSRTGEVETLIFNPPASAPSVYHTPFKFLPKSDPRRQSKLSTLVVQNLSQDGNPLPAPATKNSALQPRRNVTREQVDEMRQLRAENPELWTVVALAKRFQCTKVFVMMCCRASKEHQEAEAQRLEDIKSMWGPIRTKAREERQKRNTMLLRGEL